MRPRMCAEMQKALVAALDWINEAPAFSLENLNIYQNPVMKSDVLVVSVDTYDLAKGIFAIKNVGNP